MRGDAVRVRLAGDEGLYRLLADELHGAARAGRKLAGPRLLGGARTFTKGSPLRGRARLRHAGRALVGLRLPRLRELANLTWLRANGFDAPRPLVGGGLFRAGLPCYQFLVTEEVAGAATLREALAAADPEERAILARAVGDTAGRLHAAGFVHRDLFPRNLLVRKGEARVWLVDAWRGGPGRGLRGPAYDLGCLALHAPLILRPEEEQLLFDAYFAARAPALAGPARAALLHRAARERHGLVRRARERPQREGGLVPPDAWTPPA